MIFSQLVSSRIPVLCTTDAFLFLDYFLFVLSSITSSPRLSSLCTLEVHCYFFSSFFFVIPSPFRLISWPTSIGRIGLKVRINNYRKKKFQNFSYNFFQHFSQTFSSKLKKKYELFKNFFIFRYQHGISPPHYRQSGSSSRR